MVTDSPERLEEKRLIIRLSKAEMKAKTSEDDFKMEAIAELAAANNQLAGFYEGINKSQEARDYYKSAVENWDEAIRLAVKYGSSSSEHIYRELVADSNKSLKRIKENKDGLVEKVNATGTLAASALGLAGGLALLTPTLTGNSIGNLSTQTAAFLGAGFLIIGLVSGFFWFKNRKK